MLLTLLAAACVEDSTPGRTVASETPTVAAPTTEAVAAASVTGGTFRYGIGEPRSIVPPLVSTPSDVAVADALFDSLTRWGPGGTVDDAAATAWTASDGARVWTFTLRAGATYHDGTPVTATDFVAAWSLLVARGSNSHLLRDVTGYGEVTAGRSDTLRGLTAPDATTLRVELARPRADLPIVAGHVALGPLPADMFRADPDAFAEQPTGNGPFRMSEPWAHGDFIRVVRAEGWANGPRAESGVGEVVFGIADLDTGFLAFRQGRRDFVHLPPEAVELATEEYPPTGGAFTGPGLIDGPAPSVYVFGIEPGSPPYRPRDVRRATSLLVDRDRIVGDTGRGLTMTASSLIPEPIPGSQPGVCDACTFNPLVGARLLAAHDVIALRLAFDSGGGHAAIRDVLRDTLDDIGVGLISNGRRPAPDFRTYLDRLEAGGVGMFRLAVTADVPSGLDLLYPLLHSSQTPDVGGFNYMGYRNPLVDSLLDQAARTLDDQARESLLRRVEAVALNDDQVIIPVFGYRVAAVASDRVQGLRYDPFASVNLTGVRLVS